MGSVGQGLEEAEEGNLMGGEARGGGRGGADLRNVDGMASESGEHKTIAE